MNLISFYDFMFSTTKIVKTWMAPQGADPCSSESQSAAYGGRGHRRESGHGHYRYSK